MPRRAKSTKRRSQTIVGRIKAGKVAPLISNAIGNDLVLDGHAALVAAYAEQIEYPLASPANLPQLVQFKRLTANRQLLFSYGGQI